MYFQHIREIPINIRKFLALFQDFFGTNGISALTTIPGGHMHLASKPMHILTSILNKPHH